MTDAKELFLDLLDLPHAEREARLEEACGEDATLRQRVRDLLSAHGEADRVLGEDTQAAPRPAWSGPAPGERIDHYLLLEPIGEGGFGQVFLAEQEEPVKRRVALKVIRLGMNTRQIVSRFEAERQTLAMMDHPNIAKVHDAGATKSGHPYFVMEYVEGEPITAYCERERASVRERLELFHTVCLAVRHAHQKAVLHRDIKPHNVLVAKQDGRPVVKVIDFGIAKALDASADTSITLTHEGQVIGTPAYMSPEQVIGRGDIDTRSDVYALGALLYELLTGVQTFDFAGIGLAELQELIRDVDPPRPSQRLRRETKSARATTGATTSTTSAIPQDLDWICLRCLEKDRTRRYDSASSLADDVRRFLDDEPVEAAPPGAAYRMRKFVRRHRMMVAGAAILAVGLTVAGSGLGLGIVRARRAEADARAEAVTSGRVAGFLGDMVEGLDPEELGVALMADLRTRAADAIRDRSDSDAEADARLADLARALAPVNPTDLARTVLDDAILRGAVETVDRELADEPLIAARLRRTIGLSYMRFGLFDDAARQLELALDVFENELGARHDKALATKLDLAILSQRRGRPDDAEALFLDALEDLGTDHPRTLGTRSNLATVYSSQTRYAEAESLHRDVVNEFRRLHGDDHADTLRARCALAVTLRASGQLGEAAEIYEEVHAGQTALLGPEHGDTLITQNNLANLLIDLARYAEAGRLLESTVELRKRGVGERHPSTMRAMSNLARIYHESGQLDRAEAMWLDVLEIQRIELGTHYAGEPQDYLALKGLAGLYADRGRFDEAESMLGQVVEAWTRLYGKEHRDTLHAMNALAQVYLDQRRYDEGEALTQETLELQRSLLGEEHGDTLATLNNLAVVLVRRGRFAEAQEAFEASLDVKARTLGDRHTSTTRARYNLGCLAAIQGNDDEAVGWLREAADTGYANVDQIEKDSDLDRLRGRDDFAEVVDRVRANRIAE